MRRGGALFQLRSTVYCLLSRTPGRSDRLLQEALGCLIVSRPSGVISHITANQVSGLGWSRFIIAASAAEVSEHKRHRRAPRRRLTGAVHGYELLCGFRTNSHDRQSFTLLSRTTLNWIYDGRAAKSIGYRRERRGYTYLHLICARLVPPPCVINF